MYLYFKHVTFITTTIPEACSFQRRKAKRKCESSVGVRHEKLSTACSAHSVLTWLCIQFSSENQYKPRNGKKKGQNFFVGSFSLYFPKGRYWYGDVMYNHYIFTHHKYGTQISQLKLLFFILHFTYLQFFSVNISLFFFRYMQACSKSIDMNQNLFSHFSLIILIILYIIPL